MVEFMVGISKSDLQRLRRLLAASDVDVSDMSDEDVLQEVLRYQTFGQYGVFESSGISVRRAIGG